MADFLVGFALGLCIGTAMDELGLPPTAIIRILDL